MRILVVLLAVFAASLADIFFLGAAKRCTADKAALHGWGVGGALGGAACAVMPWVLTGWRKGVVRDSTGYMGYLGVVLAVAWFAVLPKGSMTHGVQKADDEFEEIDLGSGLLFQDGNRGSRNIAAWLSDVSWQTKRMFLPYILPLFQVLVFQGLLYPGFSRASSASIFDTYSPFLAAYGLTFQLGNVCGRALYPVLKSSILQSKSPLIPGVILLALLLLVTTIILPFLVFPIVFAGGLWAGTGYMLVFVRALDEVRDQGMGMGVVSSGEPAGLLVGGVLGYCLENIICLIPGDGDRWCHVAR